MGIIIEIIKELNIEVSSPNVFQAVVAKQYDMNTRFIKATFVDNGDKIYIDPEATVKVVINALRPDGEAKGFDGEVNQDGTVTVPLHSWMLEQVGSVTCDISVIDTDTDDNKKLTTTSFTLFVEKAAWGGDGITSDPQYDVLVQLLEDVEKVVQDGSELETRVAQCEAELIELDTALSSSMDILDELLPPIPFTFTVTGNEYQALNGMTWLEWVNSEYNIHDYTCSDEDDYVHPGGSSHLAVRLNDYVLVVGSDTIMSDMAYRVDSIS